tara:strand:- start:1924 stop:2406 length:483 start_codon:yes stop_codon:yes gene_type:complete
MAGTSGETLTVTLTESLTIDDRDYGGLQSMTFANVLDVTRRLVTVLHTTESVIATFAAVIGPGGFIASNVKYMRFTNLDDTNFITLTFRNQDNDEFAIKLDAGKSFLWCSDNSGGMVDVFNATQDADAAYSTNFGDLTNLQARADTGSVDLEFYIAGGSS